MKLTRWALGIAVVGLVSVAGSAPALAQGYPAKPVRLIVPFSPGGPADAIARTLGSKLAEQWNQPVVVDNRTGAGGNIAADLAAKAAPDGHTVVLVATSHAINATLFTKLPFDPVKDFTPITEVASHVLVLVTHPSVQASSVKELVALAKAKPGQLTFASSGNGTVNHLAGELFRSMAGIDLVHVPYKGAAPATADLLGGQVSMMFNNPMSALPHVKTGKLRALGVTGTKRFAHLPDSPTIHESGLAGFETTTWYGVLAPAGVPREVITKLHADIARALAMPDTRERLAAQGLEAVGTTPEEFAVRLRAEIAKWGKLVKATGAKAD